MKKETACVFRIQVSVSDVATILQTTRRHAPQFRNPDNYRSVKCTVDLVADKPN